VQDAMRSSRQRDLAVRWVPEARSGVSPRLWTTRPARRALTVNGPSRGTRVGDAGPKERLQIWPKQPKNKKPTKVRTPGAARSLVRDQDGEILCSTASGDDACKLKVERAKPRQRWREPAIVFTTRKQGIRRSLRPARSPATSRR